MDIYDFMALLKKNNIEAISDYDIEDEVANAKRLLA
jgi:predicted HTH domain antitoxin